eukprot:14847130-Alexandrium_andersonii.AAC.1
MRRPPEAHSTDAPTSESARDRELDPADGERVAPVEGGRLEDHEANGRTEWWRPDHANQKLPSNRWTPFSPPTERSMDFLLRGIRP